MRAAALDAVTLDAYGTLVTLRDPVPALVAALAERGVERAPDAVLAGFRAEVAHYGEHSHDGNDEDGLQRLQRECAGVFLTAVGAGLDAGEFAPAFVGALRFEPLPGVAEALAQLRGLGLELAVVANWDLSIGRLLGEAGLARFFSTIVHAARKPAPDGFLRALAELGIAPARALHVGDDAKDEQGATAAGLEFAPAPLTAVLRSLG
jgi:HAD superfamily hydrolase (TIGR01509 family)